MRMQAEQAKIQDYGSPLVMRKQGFLRIPLRSLNCLSEDLKLQLHLNSLVLQNSDTIKREIQNQLDS